MEKTQLITLYADIIERINNIKNPFHSEIDFYLHKKSIVKDIQLLVSNASFDVLDSITNSSKSLISAVLASELSYEEYKKSYFYIENTALLLKAKENILGRNAAGYKDSEFLYSFDYITENINIDVLLKHFKLDNIADYFFLKDILSYKNKMLLCEEVAKNNNYTLKQKLNSIVNLDNQYSSNIVLFSLILGDIDSDIPQNVTQNYLENFFSGSKDLGSYIKEKYGIELNTVDAFANYFEKIKKQIMVPRISKNMLAVLKNIKNANLLKDEEKVLFKNLYLNVNQDSYKNICINSGIDDTSFSTLLISFLFEENIDDEQIDFVFRYINTVSKRDENDLTTVDYDRLGYFFNLLDTKKVLSNPNSDKLIDKICNANTNITFQNLLLVYFLINGKDCISQKQIKKIGFHILENYQKKEFPLLKIIDKEVIVNNDSLKDLTTSFWGKTLKTNPNQGVTDIIRKAAYAIDISNKVDSSDKQYNSSNLSPMLYDLLSITWSNCYRDNFMALTLENFIYEYWAKPGVIFENRPKGKHTNIYAMVFSSVFEDLKTRATGLSTIEGNYLLKIINAFSERTNGVFDNLVYEKPFKYLGKECYCTGDVLNALGCKRPEKFKTISEIVPGAKKGFFEKFSFNSKKVDYSQYAKPIYKAQIINGNTVLSFEPTNENEKQSNTVVEEKSESASILDRDDYPQEIKERLLLLKKEIDNLSNIKEKSQDLFDATQSEQLEELTNHFNKTVLVYNNALDRIESVKKSDILFLQVGVNELTSKEKLNDEIIKFCETAQHKLAVILSSIDESIVLQDIKQIRVTQKVLMHGAKI